MPAPNATQRQWQEKFKVRVRKALGDAKKGKRGAGQQLWELQHDLCLRQLKHPWIGARPEILGKWLDDLRLLNCTGP